MESRTLGLIKDMRGIKMKETPVTGLKYLRRELDIDNDFLFEWRRLSQQDKDELKDYAAEEIYKKLLEEEKK
jgi:hypothetical protein|tara:strand:- start:750 stop:965 length:216 start_codon:yes stop_codon:yes gene_type:complete